MWKNTDITEMRFAIIARQNAHTELICMQIFVALNWERNRITESELCSFSRSIWGFRTAWEHINWNLLNCTSQKINRIIISIGNTYCLICVDISHFIILFFLSLSSKDTRRMHKIFVFIQRKGHGVLLLFINMQIQYWCDSCLH